MCVEKFACEFKCRKRSMSLIEVIDRGFNTELAQKANTSKAQYLFLHDARLCVAAVKMARDHAVDFIVFVDIGVEQIKSDTSNLSNPCLSMHLPSPNVNAHRDAFARVIRHGIDRQAQVKYIVVMFFLPAVVRDVL